MTIYEMFNVIKTISEDSNMVSTVKLIKSISEIDEVINASKLRAILVSPMGTSGDNASDFVYKILIIDKVDGEDDKIFLSSINDGLSLSRDFVESSTKVYNNRAEIRNMNISSGKSDEELLTSIDFELVFEYDAIPL